MPSMVCRDCQISDQYQGKLVCEFKLCYTRQIIPSSPNIVIVHNCRRQLMRPPITAFSELTSAGTRGRDAMTIACLYFDEYKSTSVSSYPQLPIFSLTSYLWPLNQRHQPFLNRRLSPPYLPNIQDLMSQHLRNNGSSCISTQRCRSSTRLRCRGHGEDSIQ